MTEEKLIRDEPGLNTEQAAEEISERIEPRAEEPPTESPPVESSPEYTQHSEQYSQQANAARQQLAQARAQVEAQVAQLDLESLRRSNPGQYAATLQQITDARRQLDQQEQQIGQWELSAREHLAKHQTQAQAQHMAAEEAALLKEIPEWRDHARRNAEAQEIIQYLIERGYSPQQIEGVTARDVLMARDAVLGRRPKRSPRKAEQKTRAESEIERRHLREHSTEAAALKIQERLAG